MDNKFTMGLVWHNCETYPPKENYNDNLIATDGVVVLDMVWRKETGYFVGRNGWSQVLEPSELKTWWWADLQQTVRNFQRWRDEII